MNFPDSFQLQRREETGPGVYSWSIVFENYPCKFTVLDAFASMSWSGNSSLSATATNANLRVPLSLMDFPEEDYWLDDYRVVIQRPDLPRMTENDDTTWDITGKRLVSNHILYLLQIG